MAVAWKKVYVEGDDIPVTDGGTGVGSFSDGAVILGNGTGDLDEVAMGANEILVGVSGANPTSQAVGGNLTMDSSGDFTISALQVTGGSVAGMIQENTTLWTYNEGGQTGLTSAKPILPFYKPSADGTARTAEDTVAPATAGDTLQYDAGNNTLIWAAGSSATLTITDRASQSEADADTANYHIPFVTGTSGSDGFNVDSTALKYNPATNLLTNGFVTLDGDTAYAAGTLGSGTQGSAAAAAGGTVTASNFVGLASEARKVDIHTVTSVGNTHAIPFYEGNGLGFQPLMSESDATFAYTPNTGLLNVTAITATGTINTLDLTVTNTINGTVENANTVTITNEAGTDSDAQAIRYLTFVDGNSGAQSLETDSSDLIYYPYSDGAGTSQGGTLKVPNLIVTGTTTTIDTTNLAVKDETIKVGTGNTTSMQAVGAGILANIGAVSDSNLPGITYAGINNAPGGWNISRAANDTASASSITTGISTMEIDSAMVTSNYADGNGGAITFGVGSFLWSGATGANPGGLFIQTSV